jgi:hypothetical protein
MKVLNIIALVFGFVFIGVAIYYIDAVQSARWANIFNDYARYDKEVTVEGGLVSILCILFFAAVYILNLILVKTKTTKVLSIIGLPFTLFALLWMAAMISSPGHMSFDEVGAAPIIYYFFSIAFSIVFLIQSISYSKKKKQLA